MSQPKERLRSLKLQKKALRDRCLEYLKGLEKVLTAEGPGGAPLLNLHELLCLQTNLYFCLAYDVHNFASGLRHATKARKAGVSVPPPYETIELMRLFPDVSDEEWKRIKGQAKE